MANPVAEGVSDGEGDALVEPVPEYETNVAVGAPVVLPEGDAESDTKVAVGSALALAETVGASPAAHAACEPEP